MAITHIVSDMGGVLIELQWLDRVKDLLGRPVAIDEIHKLWVSAPSTVEFESGRTDFDAFAAAFFLAAALEEQLSAEVVRDMSCCNGVTHRFRASELRWVMSCGVK